jgi:hypothetical protein
VFEEAGRAEDGVDRGRAAAAWADQPENIITMHYRGFVWQIPFLFLIYMGKE